MTVSVSEERRTAIGVLEADSTSRTTITVLALALGGVLIFTILSILAFTTVDWSFSGAAVSPFGQMERHALLFHERFPAFAAIPAQAFAILAWICVAGIWAVYLPLVWKLREQWIDYRVVLTGAVVLGLLALIVPPVFSTDPFSYAMYAKLATVYHANPYVATATTIAPADSLMPYLYWRDIPSPYGPVWTMASQLIVSNNELSPFELVFRFKIIAFVLVLIDGWVVYSLVRQRWPEQAGWFYLAFAWNPVVLIEGVVIGHNDVLILAVMLGSSCLLMRSRPVLSIAGLTVGALIKYSTLPVVGLCGLRMLLRTPLTARFWLTLRLAVVTLTVAVCSFFPYWVGFRSLMSTVNEPGRGANNAIVRVIGWALSAVTGGRLTIAMPVVSIGLAAILFGSWQLTTIWKSRHDLAVWTIHDELASWADSLIIFLLLWPRIRTWYFLVPLGLTLAAGNARRRVSFWVLLGLTVYSYISYFK